MRFRDLSFWVALIIPLSAQGCFVDFDVVRGSGNVVKEERKVSDVSGVELATFGNLQIKLGDEEKLVIEAEDNLLEYFETDVWGGTLTIKTERGVNLRPRKPVKYYLTVKGLDKILLSSSGNIEAPDLEAERFLVKSSSSGNLTMGNLDAASVELRLSSSGSVDVDDVRAEELEVHISSSGGLRIEGGKVEKQDVTLSSSGSYNARDLDSEEARVRVSSSGGVTVRVSDYLRATTNSSGSVRYIGNPEVDSRSTSSGRVKRMGRSL